MPGPGQYDAKRKTEAPLFGFGSEERPAPGKASKSEQRPAPRAYHSEARPGNKGCTMGGKVTAVDHSQRERAGVPAPNAYD